MQQITSMADVFGKSCGRQGVKQQGEKTNQPKKPPQPKIPELYTQQRQNIWQEVLDILSGDI